MFMTKEEKIQTEAAIAELHKQIRTLQTKRDEDAVQPTSSFPKPTGQSITDINAKKERERKDRDVKGWS